MVTKKKNADKVPSSIRGAETRTSTLTHERSTSASQSQQMILIEFCMLLCCFCFVSLLCLSFVLNVLWKKQRFEGFAKQWQNLMKACINDERKKMWRKQNLPQMQYRNLSRPYWQSVIGSCKHFIRLDFVIQFRNTFKAWGDSR